MSKDSERPVLRLDGDEGRCLYAAWSRSGKRVIVSAGRSWDEGGQVELTPEQAERLAGFLQAGPDAN